MTVETFQLEKTQGLRPHWLRDVEAQWVLGGEAAFLRKICPERGVSWIPISNRYNHSAVLNDRYLKTCREVFPRPHRLLLSMKEMESRGRVCTGI